MYSVLLVDDELLMLETLRDYVDWNSMDIDRIYCARNGKKAYDMIQEYEPDIMITDIHMPVMNGIELALKVHKEGCRTKIVFLTGYDDFEYIRTAFQVEAADYILKPFSTEGICETIGRVKAMIAKENLAQRSLEEMERVFMERIVTEPSDEGADAAVVQLCELMGEAPQDMKFGMVQVLGRNVAEAACGLENKFSEILCAIPQDSKTTILIHGGVRVQDAAQRFGHALELSGGRFNIIYSREAVPIDRIREAGRCFMSLEDEVFYLAPSAVVSDVQLIADRSKSAQSNTTQVKSLQSHPSENGHWQDELESFIQSFTEAEFDTAQAHLNGYFNGFAAARIQKEKVCESAFECLQQMYDTYVKENIWLLEQQPKLTKVWESFLAAGNILDIEQVFREYMDKIQQYFIHSHGDKYNNVVYMVKKYVEANYNKPMMVEEVADMIHLSPNYIRNIFKEKTGKTILEWMTDYRMEKACTLLKNKVYKIKEVSQEVGYENVTYFCALFLKKYGVSPNEYKKRY